MRLSKTAQDYCRLTGNQKVDEINNRFRADVKQLISRFQGQQYLAGTRNKAVAEAYIKYLEMVVNVRIDAFIEAYEQDNQVFDDDDIENFLQELQSDSRKNWISELFSQDKHDPGRAQIAVGFNLFWPEILNATRDTRLAIHRKGREKLLTAMKKQIESRTSSNASAQGGVQTGESPDLAINIDPKFDEAIASLLELIHQDTTLDKYQKEDAVDALNKLPGLAREEQTERVIKRAKDKLELFRSIISISPELDGLTAPHLPIITQHFHLPS